jgi:glycosyltransferase involved in cell wall biosynthesis
MTRKPHSILIVTSEWPRYDGDITGIHVVNQIRCLKQAGMRVDVFPFLGRKNLLNYWRASREFNRLDLAQYDIIHAHHGQSGLVALSQRHRPVVVTFHGSDLQGIRDAHGQVTFTGYILRHMSRWVASQADTVILVSESLARHLPHNKKYHVVPAGIDTQLFRPLPMRESRQVLSLPSDGHLVLFVGDPLRPEKRYWLAEQTLKHLPGDLPVQLIIANNVAHTQMPFYMNACDALLVTSSTEGSPNAVKEALACNLPVISTDVGDVRSRIASIPGCQVCQTEQPESLAVALIGILSRSSRIQGRETVLELDEMGLTARVIDLYHQTYETSSSTLSSSSMT